MKTLYLVRHAKAGDHSNLHDFERTLNVRGEKEAAQVAKKLFERRISIDLILASPAYRTLGTAQIISKAMHYPADKIATDKRIYEAEDKTLMNVLSEVSDVNQSVMMVGHNPGCTEFANNIFNTMVNSMATSAIIGGTLSINSWKDLSWGVGKMEFYIYPEDQMA
jgi:phosphohistidine phosphatase